MRLVWRSRPLFALPPLPRNLSAALRDLASKRDEIRQSALVDLVHYVDTSERPEIVAAVRRVLLSDPQAEVRSIAALVIADGQLRELSAELLTALTDEAPRVRQLALLAIGELGVPVSRDDLAQIRPLLDSALPALRYQALVTWSRVLGPASGWPELITALDDTDDEVRWVAWSLIEEALMRHQANARGDNAADASIPPQTIDRLRLRGALESRASDSVLRIQVIAASVLFRLGDASPMDRLCERIQHGGKLEQKIVVDLIERWGRLQYEPARSWLTRHARRGWLEGPFGWSATVALGALGDLSAQSAILAELDVVSARRRERALKAVKELKLVAARERVLRLTRSPSGVDPWLAQYTLEALVDSTER